ncbi:MAG: TM2 domain-containing protein [Clostridia bacterium]|nr:TM2 domain-containing protein [Clostridia bacterium]
MEELKFCKHCGEKIPYDAVICIKCGRQVETIGGDKEGIVINNVTSASSFASANNNNFVGMRLVNKWISFFLCLFLGYFGAHKFYEGKIGLGLVYVFTFGIFGIGWIIDLISILFKPNPYAV